MPQCHICRHAAYIRHQPVAQPDEIRTDVFDGITISPKFVRYGGITRIAASMIPKHRTECTILKPSCEYFTIRFIGRITAKIAPNVCSPIWDSCSREIQSSGNLQAQLVHGGRNVSRPYRRAIPLLSSPCAAGKHIMPFAGAHFVQQLLEITAMKERVYIPHTLRFSQKCLLRQE